MKQTPLHTLFRTFLWLPAIVLAGARVLAAGEADREVTSNSTGTHQGFYYSFWKDTGTVKMTMGADGRYGVTWDLGLGNFVGGKGWETGSSSRKIGYSVQRWEPEGNAYLTLYGWTTSPLIEYYVVDSWGSWRPPGAKPVGTMTSDGGTYELYRTQRVEQPSIQGTATFYQYWSVRTEKRTGEGDRKITFANHVEAWRQQGWELGTHNYQILASEGYQSSGRSDLRVWEE